MEKTAVYGVINVVAHPHPEGTYRNIFEKAGGDPMGVRFHGDRFATLSPISSSRNGVFTGKLATWTEIDPESNLIEKSSLKESLLSDSEFKLPEGVGFNSRVFSFAFREKDHKLFIELKNDENQSISVGRAKLAISKILEQIRLDGVEELDAYVATASDAVDQVLAIPALRKVEISLDLPNPDDLSDRKKKLLDQIESAKAKRMKTELTKSAGEERLVVEGDFLAMAELAKDNGYLNAVGRTDEGEPVERSTKSYPMMVNTILMQDESRAIATRRIAETHDGE